MGVDVGGNVVLVVAVVRILVPVVLVVVLVVVDVLVLVLVIMLVDSSPLSSSFASVVLQPGGFDGYADPT